MAYSQVPLSTPASGRHEDMPVLYRAFNHPLLRTATGVRNVYIGYMQTDSKSMRQYYEFERKMGCPDGDVAKWKDCGLVELLPGDYLFLRDPVVSEDPSNDTLAVMVTGRSHHGDDEISAFETATQHILGPKHERSPGSTAFEDVLPERRVKGARTYSIGSSVQQHRKVVAPNASLNKAHSQDGQVYQGMVKRLLDSTSSLLLNVRRSLPKDCRTALEADDELAGRASAGKRGVWGPGGTQLNISAAGISSSDKNLESQLGDFGRPHYDPLDSPDHLTTMFSNPDLPRNYNPGFFHILQLGVFIALRKYVGITFSGRRRHVGTSPTPPKGTPSVSSAYRFTSVHYPQAAALDGSSSFTLASLPGKPSGSQARNGDALYITPEMTNKENAGFVSQTTRRSTYAGSGHAIMDRDSHVTFVARSLHQLNAYVYRQLPPIYKVKIDTKKAMEAISYTNERGKRVRLSDWPSAPNVQSVSKQRRSNEKIWKAYQERDSCRMDMVMRRRVNWWSYQGKTNVTFTSVLPAIEYYQRSVKPGL
ncbi:hypothetical protein NMY22_g5264 [Coprinellus aureogranulatus]|nr:hypothetical protein NMY22_g5264 [Coprinellus aureogranulatus]